MTKSYFGMEELISPRVPGNNSSSLKEVREGPQGRNFRREMLPARSCSASVFIQPWLTFLCIALLTVG